MPPVAARLRLWLPRMTAGIVRESASDEPEPDPDPDPDETTEIVVVAVAPLAS